MRPKSYWDDKNALASALRDVKGTQRRNLIEQCWQDGMLESLPEDVLKGTMPQDAREDWGRIHPMFMGGEYLPDFGSGETEIARLELRSTTADVISIRGRRAGARIHYRIVDEYDTRFEQQRKTSRIQLTLEELIRFIDGSSHPDLAGRLALCYNEMNADGGGDRRSLRDFTRVRSAVYPQLEEHYRHVFDEWAEGAL